MNDNNRIAVNSLVLYAQLVITTIVGLIATRIVLKELGTNDFGLYSVIGGLVAMMGVLSAAMLSTSYRYLSVEMGKGVDRKINNVFNTILVVHLFLAIVLLIITETVGMWYINNYLNIDKSKLSDAIFILHFTAIVSVLNIIGVPFRGLITAKENFFIRSFSEVFAAFIKIGLLIFLILYSGNKLRTYAVIMAIFSSIPLLIIFIYCKSKYSLLIQWKFNKNFADYFGIFGFTFWILVGTIAYMGVRQGAAVIVNLFFGTGVNAAFGIAMQVNNYVMLFVKNLNQAAVPQIMKSHSSGDLVRSINLVYTISRYSYYIMLIPAIPILLSMDTFLTIWLKIVPEYTAEFTILMIINGLLGVTTSGFDAAVQATGKIKMMQLWYSILMLFSLPVSYLLFKAGYPPYSITIAFIISALIFRGIQMKIVAHLTEFSFRVYYRKTFFPVLLVTVSLMPLIFIRHLFGQDLISTILISVVCEVIIIIAIYFIGLTPEEKSFLRKKILGRVLNI